MPTDANLVMHCEILSCAVEANFPELLEDVRLICTLCVGEVAAFLTCWGDLLLLADLQDLLPLRRTRYSAIDMRHAICQPAAWIAMTSDILEIRHPLEILGCELHDLAILRSCQELTIPAKSLNSQAGLLGMLLHRSNCRVHDMQDLPGAKLHAEFPSCSQCILLELL